MRLKKLILHGFKSFADRTEFVFDAPIVGIVGPNGCGKSNVVDGFKWVLGEQSAKSLRGEAMLDVIFNGSGNRKPAGMSEVTLVFENPRRADGTRTLNIDVDEVSVGRRLFRDGTSEYQLNNQTAAQTAQAYDAMLVAERHRQDLTDGKSYAEDFLKKTEARYQAGTVAKLDVIKAKVDVAQAGNALIANERAIATTRAALNRLLGRQPGSAIEAADDLANVPPSLPDVESLAAIATSSRPEIRSALVQREGARDATRLAKQYWLPDLNFVLARNYTAGDPPAYSTAFSFNLPLFFWQHSNGPIAEAQHREAELEATSRDTRAQVELDLRTAYAAADTARRQALFVRDELLPQAEEAYRIASINYALGGTSALELLDRHGAPILEFHGHMRGRGADIVGLEGFVVGGGPDAGVEW
jgi:energy-coupling factor transporter ATP-binding protein EcfA2